MAVQFIADRRILAFLIHFINANVDLSMIEINRILMKDNLMLIVVKS